MERTTKHFEDLGFFVTAEPFDYYVEFKIYQVEGVMENGQPLFHQLGAISYPAPVDQIEEAEIYASGSVKWDGCSNWRFDEQDRVMLHGCNKDHLLNLGKILAECWEMTADLCPNWLGD